MTPLDRISERVGRFGDPNDPKTPRPLLSIEEFFEGNTHVGSIGCNLPGSPSPRQLHALFQEIARRSEVEDIRVRITSFDDPDWPFSDTVFVMTVATPKEVASWFPEELAPDEVRKGFLEGETYEPHTLPAGCCPIACWWD